MWVVMVKQDLGATSLGWECCCLKIEEKEYCDDCRVCFGIVLSSKLAPPLVTAISDAHVFLVCLTLCHRILGFKGSTFGPNSCNLFIVCSSRSRI